MYHPLEKMAFHLNKLEFPSSKDACVEFGLNWLSGSGERDFLTSSMYFHYLIIISTWKRARPSFEQTWITKDVLFSWNWHSSFVEDENVKIYDNDDVQRTIRKNYLSLRLMSKADPAPAHRARAPLFECF